MKRSILAVAVLATARLAFAQGSACTIADFTKPHKWGNPHHVANVVSSDQGLSFAIDGEDPWFFGPTIEIPAVPEEPRRLAFTMTCAPTTRASSWQLFFAPASKPYSEKMSCRLYPVGDPPYTRFSTRGAVPFNLKGPCHFRLDPPPGSNETFTVKNLSMEWRKPLWSYTPQKVPPLIIPASTPLVLKGKGWELRHDPDRIGAFRFISRGKTVENLPEEPFVYLDKFGKVRTLDWSKAKMSGQVNSDSGITTEAALTDADGRRWRIIRSFISEKPKGNLAILTHIETSVPGDEDEPAKVLHVPALTLFVDRASNGHKNQAMLAGVEYLDDEPSSNTKEIRTHEHNRLIPAEYRLSAPMAVLAKDGNWFAAVWMEMQKIQKGYAGPSKCATVFDTPDRLFKSGGHLLAFWAPAVGPARCESELDVYEPVPFRSLGHWTVLMAGEGASVADALETCFAGNSPMQPDKIDQTATLEQLAHGWLDSAIREGVKVKHAIGGHFKANLVADAPVLMQYLASALDREEKGDKALASRLRSTAEEILAAVPKRDVGFTSVSHVRRPAPVLVAGDVPAYLARKDADLKSGNITLVSGKRIWKPQPGKPDYGETLGADHCNGYTAMALDGLLSAATWSGDEAEIAKALAIVDKATALYHGTVPRGAQPWEMPLHTPDIMASAHLVRIYTLAYLLKPDPAYLREARHWAYGGLSMVYLMPPPFDFGADVKPVGLYATCAVMGATRWVTPNWIGRPVQWCGLVYSAALWDLARIEPDVKARAFWRRLATGITVSGARQNHTADEPRFVGLLPDSWNLEHQSRYPIPINPGTVQENFAEYVKMPFYSLRALARADGGAPALVHAAGDVEALAPEKGILRCRIAAWPQAPSKVVVTRVAKPHRVLFDGVPVKFEYIPARRALVVEIPAAARGILTVVDSTDEFALQRAEFAKYHRMITGKDAPEGIVRFAIDPKISKSGRDAYAIKSNAINAGAPSSGWRASQPAASGRAPSPALITIIGSNVRSVWYGLYDLLERRGGCRWFWDGDVVPKRDSIDLSNLDVHEEAHFEYRAIRYFAHRGLTRFQAEHWGPKDWKREIDWLLKKRLNVFMLRIGQDDLFQRAFPEACKYPDPSKRLPGATSSYNDRTLFWSLQYRGELRRKIQKYGFDRGLLAPEDFGTMTHWYSRTPEDWLANKRPQFLPQSSGSAAGRNGLVWDIRDDKWVDAYWKLTTTAVEQYGAGAPKPQLLHTIGLSERSCYKERKKNFDLKIEALNKFFARAKRDYPDAKILLSGWDFYGGWKPEEVRAFLPQLDKNRVILWDYEADCQESRATFVDWDVIGKFPYTYSTILAFEAGLDVRADYPFIEKRQRLVQNDPLCVGWIHWPESAHTDTLFLDFFTANAWAEKPIPHGEVLDAFCAGRYGKNTALMKSVWADVLDASALRRWDVYSESNLNCAQHLIYHGLLKKGYDKRPAQWGPPVAKALAAVRRLESAPWDDAFVRRDAIDIVRMVLDRLIVLKIDELGCAIAAWRGGKTTSVQQQDDLVARTRELAALFGRLADVLALHTDYSLWESYQRLDAIERIQNPDFSQTLFENAVNQYCLSHQYEAMRHVVAPAAAELAERIAKAVAAGDRKAGFSARPAFERIRKEAKAKPLESLKPTLPRTAENFRLGILENVSVQ